MTRSAKQGLSVLTYSHAEAIIRLRHPHIGCRCGGETTYAELCSYERRASQMNQRQHKSWWARNWKWSVPVICLGSLVLLAGLIAFIMYVGSDLVKSSDVYQEALAKAMTHPSVRAAVGMPVEGGMSVTARIIRAGDGSGQARLSIPISGPDGKATIYVVAARSAGQWTFSTLVMEIKETKQRIDLLGEGRIGNSILSKEQIITAANVAARQHGWNPKKCRIFYDEGNAKWKSVIEEDVPSLARRDFQVVAYGRQEIVLGGPLLVLVDRNTGDVLKVLALK